ncbi:MAG: ribonuclease III domain-containing protein [Bacillota bacterium]|nr:ribonuclease III domain-containing protein [Bacillota bacterium]
MSVPTSSLVLAYVGDAVFELWVRERLARREPGRMVNLHRKAVALVRAPAQAALLRRLEGLLTPEEEEVVRRARNAKSGPAPRGVPVQDYRHATAFEALLGYLYLSGRTERLAYLLDQTWPQVSI